MEKEVSIKIANQKIQSIEDQMKADSMRTSTDSDFYKKNKEAEADKLRLTKEFLQLQLIKSLLTNTKIFYGDKIPNMGFLGSEYQKIFNETKK